MDTSESFVVVSSIKFDVGLMLFFEILHHIFKILHFPRSSSHFFGRKICVAPGTVEVSE